MTREPEVFVVDASVAIKLFINEPLSAQVHSLLGHLTDDPPAQFYVPDLLFVECANILWKHVRRFGYDPAHARQSLEQLNRLGLQTVSTADLMHGAFDIAIAHEVSAYDASYVALCHRLSAPLVTADQALMRKLAGTPYRLLWLGDLPASAP